MEVEHKIELMEQEIEELRGFDNYYWKKKRERLIKEVEELKTSVKTANKKDKGVGK